MKKAWTIVLITAAMMLAGCATPSFKTTVVDPSYQGRIESLDIVLSQGYFKGAEDAMRRSGMDRREWYAQIAKDMAQIYAHNGIPATGKAGMIPVGWIENLTYSDKPTLVIEPYSVGVQRNAVVAMEVQAALFVPGRSKPVWHGKNSIFPPRAADQLGVRTLNALSAAQLITLRFPEARVDKPVTGAAPAGQPAH